jgi:uncharacterized lipoprotein NlpE involved in copper resistance
MRTWHRILTATILMALAPVSVAAQEPASGPIAASSGAIYLVQPGDWLSTIAARLLGGAEMYVQIVAATNARAAQEGDVEPIADPDLIQVGQRLWVPGGASLAGLYKGIGRSAGCCGRDITLYLGIDGTASLNTDFMNGDAPILEVGAWKQSGPMVTLTLTGEPNRPNEQPAIVSLTFDGTTLTPGNTAYPPLVSIGALATEQAALAYDPTVIQARWDAGEWPDILKAFLPAASSMARDVTLYINADGTVRLCTDYLNGEEPIVEVGTWEARDGGVRIALTGRPDQAPYATPDVMQLTPQDGILQAQGAQLGDDGITFYSVRGLAVTP